MTAEGVPGGTGDAGGLDRWVPAWVRERVPDAWKARGRALLGGTRATPTGSPSMATEDDVVACYRLLMGRDPDPHGLRTFRADVSRGVTVEQLVSAFVNSPEFRERGILDDGAAPPELVEPGGFRMWVSPDDYAAGATLAAGGAYEPGVTEAVRTTVEPGMTFVDVGASSGYYTMLAASLVGPEGRVVAVEPGARNVTFLRVNSALNGFHHITVHPVAADAEPGLLVYDARGANGFVSDWDEGVPPVGERAVVAAVRLDDLLAGEERIDVIKIDVEGAELRALTGAAEVLDRHRPLLLVELSAGGLERLSGATPRDLLGHLAERGYGFDVLAGDEDGERRSFGADVDAVLDCYERAPAGHIDLAALPPSGSS